MTETQRLAAGEKVQHWEPFRRQAEKRLRILDSATSLSDLDAAQLQPSGGLEGKPQRTTLHPDK